MSLHGVTTDKVMKQEDQGMLSQSCDESESWAAGRIPALRVPALRSPQPGSEYCALIGQDRSRDLNTVLSLVQTLQSALSAPVFRSLSFLGPS